MPTPEPELPMPTGSDASITIGSITVQASVAPELKVGLAQQSVNDVPTPVGVQLVGQAMRVRVVGVSPGDVGEVSLELDQPIDGVRLLSSGAWAGFEFDEVTGAQVTGDGLTVTVFAKDGGRGDVDGAADGSISLPLGLGVTAAAAVSAAAPAEAPIPDMPQSAPGWDEPRPALVVVPVPENFFLSRVVVLRINSSGELQYRMQLDTSNIFTPFLTTGKWGEWTTITGTGPLKGSPAASGTNIYALSVGGSLKRIALGGQFPAGSVSVSTLGSLPGGVLFDGSPSVGNANGAMITVRGSDGEMWMSNQAGTSWFQLPASERSPAGSSAFATRPDGTGADLWIHNDDRSRRHLSYTVDTGWVDSPVGDGGPWAGSPSAARLNAPAGGSSVTVLADVDATGRIVTETVAASPARFVNGSGFVGSTAVIPWMYIGIVAAVREDGNVTLRLLTPSGDLNSAGGVIVTVGQPGPAWFRSPAHGSIAAPGAPVTMTVNEGFGATHYRWELEEVTNAGDFVPVASETLPSAGGTAWTVPADAFRDGRRYRWRALSFRSDNGLYASPGLPEWYGFTVTSGLAPIQVSPDDGAGAPIDANGSVTLVADPVPGATGYKFSLYGGSGAPFVQTTSSSSWVVPRGLTPPGTTSGWSVQAVFGSSVGAMSARRSFTAIIEGSGPPATPTLTAPADGVRFPHVGDPLDLYVSFPVDNHKKEFRFELWEVRDSGRRWVTGASTASQSWRIPGGTMSPNRLYQWTVRVYDYATAQLSEWPALRMINTTGDTLGTGQVLTAGNELRSANGHRLIMQHDGNLVVYKPDGSVKAATNRYAPDGPSYLVMQGDGNLVSYQDRQGAARRVIWASGSFGSNAYLVMQDDGNAVIYQNLGSGQRRALWASNSLIPKPRAPKPPPPGDDGPAGGGTYSPTPADPRGCGVDAKYSLSSVRSAMNYERWTSFSVPKRPEMGCFLFRISIPSKYVGPVVTGSMKMLGPVMRDKIPSTGAAGLWLFGDNLEKVDKDGWFDHSDENFDPARTRLFALVDFTSGSGHFVVNGTRQIIASCWLNFGCSTDGNPVINHTARQVRTGWSRESNWVWGGFDSQNNFRFYLNGEEPVATQVAPSINVSFKITPAGQVSVFGDKFPSVHVYQKSWGRSMQFIAASDMSASPAGLCKYEEGATPACVGLGYQGIEQRSVTSAIAETGSG